MKKKDCYLKFIRGEQCSLEEFRLAYYYRNSVNINRQIDFEMTMNSIMHECLQKMLDNKTSDKEVVRDIFEYHGLNEHYFGIFFQIYLQSFPVKKELYEKLKDTISWQFYEKIYNEIQNAKINEIFPIDLYNLTLTFPMNNELKFKIYSSFKTFYDFCVLVSWNSPKIKEEAIQKGLKYEQYLLLAKEYAIHCLNIDNIDDVILYCRCANSISKGKYAALLETILATDDVQVIDEAFAQISDKKGTISNYCHSKNRLFTDDERKETERILFAKLHDYRKRQEQAKKTIEQKSYDDIFEQYINSPLDLENFCNTISISSDYFKKRLRTANDSALINKVKEKLNLEMERKRYEKEKLMKQIIFFIRNGISFHGKVRPFDLLDFFYYYPSVNFKILKKIVKNISKEELTIYNKFFAPINSFNINDYPSYFNPNLIIQSYYEFNPKLDIEGNPIKGTGIILSQNDFIQILDFFERNQIPKLSILFDIAVKRYINQTLFTKDNLQNPVLSLK